MQSILRSVVVRGKPETGMGENAVVVISVHLLM